MKALSPADGAFAVARLREANVTRRVAFLTMNVHTMRRIDRWIGVPVCFLLTVLEKNVLRWRGADAGQPRNVLAILMPEGGSLATAEPAVRRFRRLWPDARLHFLVFERNRHFLALLGFVEDRDIFTVDDRSLGAFVLSYMGFLRDVRRRGIDTTLDLDLFTRVSAITAWLSGARRRVGFTNYRAEGLYRGALMTHPVFYNVYRHIAENFLALVEALACETLEQPAVKESLDVGLRVEKRSPDPARVAEIRRRAGERSSFVTDATRLVVLSPFSTNLLPMRSWPAAHYIAFLRGLFESTDDTAAVIMGLEGSREFCALILDAVQSPRLVDFLGQTRDVGEMMDLFHAADLFVTTDSGPPHFAAMTECPTIVLFGPECPQLYRPLGDNVKAVYLGLHCSPCVSAFNHRDTPCTNNLCMQRITPDRVLDLSLEVLRQGSV